VAPQFTLGKNERLKSRKQIEQLFSEGKKFSINPFRIFYLLKESSTPPLQFGVSVSNKNFKRAIDRNRIKRIVREAWRLQKNIFQQQLREKGKQLHVFIIYTGKEIPGFSEVSEKVKKILDKLGHFIVSEN
jgi:ribonuclease P protein component